VSSFLVVSLPKISNPASSPSSLRGGLNSLLTLSERSLIMTSSRDELLLFDMIFSWKIT